MTAPAVPFTFLDPGPLLDGDLRLVLVEKFPGDASIAYVPAYRFAMALAGKGTRVGSIELRVGHTPHLELYGGHIGYGVERAHRGHRYAARSVRLVLPLAWVHGLEPVWITCNPDNLASRRTCELAGGVYVETVALPPQSDLYRAGERFKCRYRFERPAARGG